MASIIKVDDVQDAAGNNIIREAADTITIGASGDTITIPSGATITNSGTASGFGGGKIGQVLQAVKTDTFSTTSTSFVDLTDITIAITPAASSSKVLIFVSIHAGTANLAYGQIVRDSTPIGIGETSSSRVSCTIGNFSVASSNRCNEFTMGYLDSPSTTSATTYKLQVRHENGSTSLYVNRTESDSDSATGFRPISTITVMEVLA